MPTEPFWTRVRKGHLFQVLAVYLGVSWVVLQAVDVLNWANADPELMPRVEAAKQRLARLGSDTRR